MKYRVIVLVDFSGNADSLLQIANSVSLAKSADILVMHQSDGALPGITESELTDKYKSAQVELSLVRLKTFVSGVLHLSGNVEYKVSSQHVAEQLNEISGPDITDLVLVGLKKKDFTKRMLEGSVAAKIADHTEKMILAIPENMGFKPSGRLIVAINDKFPLNVNALKAFLKFCPGFKSIIFTTVVNTEDAVAAARADLQKVSVVFDGNCDISTEVLVASDHAPVLEDFSAQQLSLLVLQRGSRGLHDVLRRFFINRFIYKAVRPMLILPLPHK